MDILKNNSTAIKCLRQARHFAKHLEDRKFTPRGGVAPSAPSWAASFTSVDLLAGVHTEEGPTNTWRQTDGRLRHYCVTGAVKEMRTGRRASLGAGAGGWGGQSGDRSGFDA